MNKPIQFPLLVSAFALPFLTISPRVHGQETATLTTLHSFSALDSSGNNSDGANPIAGLIPASSGNFYGAADEGGTSGGGAVYEITPNGTLTILANFGSDGYSPYGSPIFGSDGNLYGTTDTGGSHSSGTAYQLSLTGDLTYLHTFGGDNGSGSLPKAPLILGRDGNFYGTTYDGGSHGDGAIFQLTPSGTVTVIYSFDGSAGDGTNPHSSLIQATDGNFYGTTLKGGVNGDGTVFQFNPDGVLTTLHSFGSSTADGSAPYAALIQGTDGNFYGTTHDGAASGDGTVFRITAAGALTTLHSFGGSDGASPYAALFQGADGNFYGSTESGGASGLGTIFQLTPSGVLTTLYSFSGPDGSGPEGALIESGNGVYYGTTANGGTNNSGTVFALTLHPGFFTGETALSDGVYYLAFSNGNYFGYYSFLSEANYFYHFDLGYEYVFDAKDGHDGVYFYDFKSSDFFYTSPTFPFPYLYDFNLNTVLYYYPDPNNAGHYNTDGIRYFYDFATGTIITR